MRRLLFMLCAAALVLAASTVTVESAARPTQQQRASARKHADSGRKLFKDGKYSEAIEEFQQAEAIIHAPPHLLYIARSLDKLGKLLEAQDSYEQVVAEDLSPRAPKAFQKAQAAAREELKILAGRIPKIVVEVDGPAPEAVTVSVDGVPVAPDALAEPLPLDPGEHEVVAEAEGFETGRTEFELGGGDGTVPIRLTLSKPVVETVEPVEEPGLDLTIPAVVVLGVGAASLVVGGITGGLALDSASELRERCPTNPCPTENEELADEANTLATVSTITLIVGGVAAAAGAGWLIWDALAGTDEEADTASSWVRPLVGPGVVGVQGAF